MYMTDGHGRTRSSDADAVDVEPSASPLAAAEPQLSNAKTSNGTTGDDGAGVESSDDVEPSASPLAAVDPLRYRAPHLPSWCRS